MNSQSPISKQFWDMIPPAAKGLVAGKYRVNIMVFKDTGRKFQDVPIGMPTSEKVPVTFNEADSLEATVTAGGENHFTFLLTTKE